MLRGLMMDTPLRISSLLEHAAQNHADTEIVSRTGPDARGEAAVHSYTYAVAHPAIAEAAVIGVHHPKWDERPLLVAVRKPGAGVSREELPGFYQGKVAKWWIPDDVTFVEQLPHTATGKLLKTRLRQDLKDYQLPK